MTGLFLLFLFFFQIKSFSDVQLNENESDQRQICIVQTIGAKPVSGSRCHYQDEVMVGVRSLEPLTILCAKLQVMCNRQEEKPFLDSPQNGS